MLKLLPVRRPVSGADVEERVDVVPRCIQYNEGAKPRDGGELERTHTCLLYTSDAADVYSV